MAYEGLRPIAEKLETSPEAARDALQELLQTLHEEAEREGQANVPGLGHFVLEDGALQFKPVPPLANSVNRRFAGLAPIPVDPVDVPDTATPASGQDDETTEAAPPSAQPETPEPEPSDSEGEPVETSPWLRELGDPDEEDPLGVEPPYEEANYAVLESEDASPKSTSEEQPQTSAAESPDEAESAVPAKSSQAAPPGRPSDGEFFWIPDVKGPFGVFPHPPLVEEDFVGASVHRADAPAEEPSPAPRKQRPASPPPSREPAGQSRTVLWAAIVTVVLLLGAGAWFIANQQTGTTEAPVEQSADPPLAEETPEESNDPPPPSSEETEEPVPAGEDETDEVPSDAVEPSPEPEGIDPTPGEWTMVVASETSEATAQEIAGQMREAFSDVPYSVDVLPSTVQGTTRYRVIIGQFPTQADGQEALRERADRLPEGSWLLQFEEDL